MPEELDQAGVDFTLFQCADGLLCLVGWQAAATLGDHFGFAVPFGLAATLALGAALVAPALFARAGRAAR